MKETLHKEILLAEYSENTVRAFIDFIYLGGKTFSQNVILSKNKNEINLLELLDFAKTYEIEILLDCCTNLISLFATNKNLVELQPLTTLYEIEHLNKLFKHLSMKNEQDENSLMKINDFDIKV